MFVGLRFPTEPTCLAEVMTRRALCLKAQQQAQDGQDVTAPDGVEVVFMLPSMPFERMIARLPGHSSLLN